MSAEVMDRRVLQPPGWPQPKGYANGVAARGWLVVTGGVVGWDEAGVFPDGFLPQVRQALLNIRAILAEGGAGPEHLVRLTWYVTDMDAYRASLRELGPIYREVFGRNFPAMALVQVCRSSSPPRWWRSRRRRWCHESTHDRDAAFPHPMNTTLFLIQLLNGLQLGVLLFLVAAA